MGEKLTGQLERLVSVADLGAQRSGARAPECIRELLFECLIVARAPDGSVTTFRPVELECYCPDDPFTQLAGADAIGGRRAPPGRWHFRRTGRGDPVAELTCAPEGEAGGILLLSMQLCDLQGSAGVIEGPCACARRLLRACGAASEREQELSSAFFGGADRDGSGTLRLVLVGDESLQPQQFVAAAPRHGLNRAIPRASRALRERYAALPARYAAADALRNMHKNRPSLLRALRRQGLSAGEIARLTGCFLGSVRAAIAGVK
jgi:hypothetical protein